MRSKLPARRLGSTSTRRMRSLSDRNAGDRGTGRAPLSAAPSVVISSMEIVADSTLGAGDFAATQGRVNWVSGPKGADAPQVRRRFLMVWRRDADGRWRIARELLNEDV